MSVTTAPTSLAMRHLDDCLTYYAKNDTQNGKRLLDLVFSDFRNAETLIHENLWRIQGAPSNSPNHGKYAFNDMYGKSSTTFQKVSAIEMFRKIVYASIPHIPPYTKSCPFLPAQSCDDRSIWSKSLAHVLAPNGQYVHVYGAEAYVDNWDTTQMDTRDEVVPRNYTLPESDNGEGYRAIGDIDYAKYGFVKIGKYWVDPIDEKSVTIAKQRAKRAEDSSCLVM